MIYRNHQYYNKISAFSLIELMVAVGIIGLLTAIATPIYTSYTIKSNVSSALPILEGLKVQVSEYYTANNNFPLDLTKINATSYTDSIISGTTVSTTTCPIISGATVLGCVQVTFFNTSRANYPLNNTVLSLVAIDGGTAIKWVCKSGNSSGSTISIDYLPKSCQ